jgi:hypothetical protein
MRNVDQPLTASNMYVRSFVDLARKNGVSKLGDELLNPSYVCSNGTSKEVLVDPLSLNVKHNPVLHLRLLHLSTILGKNPCKISCRRLLTYCQTALFFEMHQIRDCTQRPFPVQYESAPYSRQHSRWVPNN